MSYPEPRRVEVMTTDVMGLTFLELARVAVVSGVAQDRLTATLQASISPGATPEQAELGAIVLYAIALQLERRLDRALTWEDAQSWRVVFVQAPVKLAEAEADAEVQAATISGAPIVPRAGDLTLAHAAAYGRHAERIRKAAPRARKR